MLLVEEIENMYGSISIFTEGESYFDNTVNVWHLPKILESDPLIKELGIKSGCVLIIGGKYYYVV